jgi:hypothetical protein
VAPYTVGDARKGTGDIGCEACLDKISMLVDALSRSESNGTRAMSRRESSAPQLLLITQRT